MSKRGRESPLTLGHSITYKKQKSDEYLIYQKESDISTKQMLAGIWTRLTKLDEEIKQTNQKVEELKNVIDSLNNTNAIQQNQIYGLYHYIGIPVHTPNKQYSYIS